MLLNSKSILDCKEDEEQLHNDEILEIQDRIFDLPNYKCVVVFKYKDIAHKDKEQVIKSCELHDFLEMIEYCDIKNGIDLKIGDNNLLTIVAHGQGYTVGDDEANYLVTEEVSIMPYEDEMEFIDISKELIEGQNNSYTMNFVN